MNLDEALGVLVTDAEVQGPDRLAPEHQWALVEVAKLLWVNLTYGVEYDDAREGFMDMLKDLGNVVVEEE